MPTRRCWCTSGFSATTGGRRPDGRQPGALASRPQLARSWREADNDHPKMSATRKSRWLGLVAGLALVLAACGGDGAGGKGGTGVNPGPIDPGGPPRLEGAWSGGFEVGRSEEHTSELQSREKLVCRLL